MDWMVTSELDKTPRALASFHYVHFIDVNAVPNNAESAFEATSTSFPT